jgi:hypothetical protein
MNSAGFESLNFRVWHQPKRAILYFLNFSINIQIASDLKCKKLRLSKSARITYSPCWR